MTKTIKHAFLATGAFAFAFGSIVLGPGSFTYTTPALAQNAPATFEECAGVPDEVERLACYDEVASAKVPDTVAAMKRAQEQLQVDQFGLTTPGPGQKLDKMNISFVSVKRNALGKIVLTTEDGHVWVQADTKRVFYPKQISGRIRKGAIGSYFFTPDNKDRPIKVKRVK